MTYFEGPEPPPETARVNLPVSIVDEITRIRSEASAASANLHKRINALEDAIREAIDIRKGWTDPPAGMCAFAVAEVVEPLKKVMGM